MKTYQIRKATVKDSAKLSFRVISFIGSQGIGVFSREKHQKLPVLNARHNTMQILKTQEPFLPQICKFEKVDVSFKLENVLL